MRIDVLTIFPGWSTAFAEHSLLGRAREPALLDLRVHDLRDATDRRAPQRGRRAVRRGGRNGADPGPHLRHGGARAAAPAAVPVGPRRSAPRPVARRRAGRQRSVLAAVRPLRGCRRAGAPASRRRRALDRRLRAVGRRGGGDGGARGGGPPGAGGDGQRGVRGRGVVLLGSAGVPAVHPTCGVPGMGGPRGAALGRPCAGRPLASGPGPGPHPGRPPRPHRPSGRPSAPSTGCSRSTGRSTRRAQRRGPDRSDARGPGRATRFPCPASSHYHREPHVRRPARGPCAARGDHTT